MSEMRSIDGPKIRCRFESKNCSSLVAEAGGFDEHHRWPKTMGGPELTEDLLILCPIHHRRQHALIRAMATEGLSVRLVKRFTRAERDAAVYAVKSWQSMGSARPHVSWNVPAAAIKK